MVAGGLQTGMARHCGNCNAAIKDHSKFCRMCGTPNSPRCQKCNGELLDRSKFCRLCGAPVRISISKRALKAELNSGGVLDSGAGDLNSGGVLDSGGGIDSGGGLDSGGNNNGQDVPIPATEHLAQPAYSVASPSAEMDDLLPASNTAKTELAPMGKYLVAEHNKAEPFAPETHALIGFFEQAGFTLRFGAFMFDLLPIMILLFVSGFLAGQFTELSTVILYASYALTIAFTVINFIVMPGRVGQSLGKRLLGIRIITVDQRRATTKQIVVRHLLGYPISSAAFALGFLWLLWDRRQQGWHDKLARTLVVRKRMTY
jgi:uncharacterized RDD family membrane protein YckC